MKDITQHIKSHVPPAVMTPILQSLLSLPAAASRCIIGEFTAPTTAQKKWIKKIKEDQWKGAWIGPRMSKHMTQCELHKKIKAANVIIFEIHGGAFRVGHCVMYMEPFIKWIKILKRKHNLNALILSVGYSLAPEHQYPTAALECVEAYKYLVEDLKIPASKIVLSGDSAGGSLAVETLVRVYAPRILQNIDSPRTNYHIELPAGLFLCSPLVSANTDTWLWEFKEDLVTPILAALTLKDYLNLPGADTTDLHILKIALIQSRFDRFLPKHVLVYVGDREVMRDDILSFAQVIKKDNYANVAIRKENYEHDWYLIREIVHKKDKHMLRRADNQLASFIARSVAEAKAANFVLGKLSAFKSGVKAEVKK